MGTAATAGVSGDLGGLRRCRGRPAQGEGSYARRGRDGVPAGRGLSCANAHATRRRGAPAWCQRCREDHRCGRGGSRAGFGVSAGDCRSAHVLKFFWHACEYAALELVIEARCWSGCLQAVGWLWPTTELFEGQHKPRICKLKDCRSEKCYALVPSDLVL